VVFEDVPEVIAGAVAAERADGGGGTGLIVTEHLLTKQPDKLQADAAREALLRLGAKASQPSVLLWFSGQTRAAISAPVQLCRVWLPGELAQAGVGQ
jgi:hypothetical protein